MGHQLTDSDLTVRLQELEEQNKALEERIAQLEDLGTSTDPKMKDELVAQIKKWKVRRSRAYVCLVLASERGYLRSENLARTALVCDGHCGERLGRDGAPQVGGATDGGVGARVRRICGRAPERLRTAVRTRAV